MKPKPSLSVVSAILVAFLFLVSCGGGGGDPQPEETAPAVETTGPDEPYPAEVPENETAPAESGPESQPGAAAPSAEEVSDVSVPETTAAQMKSEDTAAAAAAPADAGENLEVVTLGGGCFWCTEAVMQRVIGVKSVVSGYMGGHVENPTYEQIITKTTGHAEVIQVTFDTAEISLEELLDIFWQAHDPTTLNRQGADVGPQYRSVIFYHTPEQRNLAEKSMRALDESGMYPDPAVTEITAASTFWEAEDYHQNYYNLNKDSNPYCRVVISPKLQKLGLD